MAQSRKTGRAGIDKRTAKTLGADALVEAVNVLVEGDGQLRQRPGFTTETIKSTSRRPRRVFPDGLILSDDGSGNAYYETTAAAVTGLSGHAWALHGSNYNLADFARASGNSYYTNSETIGLIKRTSTASTTLSRTGMHPLGTALGTLVTATAPATAQAIDNNKAVAYRWTTSRTDANDLIVTSEPSPWKKVVNTAGATRNVSLKIWLPDLAVAGDVVDVYRSLAVPSTDTPSDELYLAATQTLTSTDISNGYVTVVDVQDETALGRALYTNSTREGILKANGLPPTPSTLAYWQDCLWANQHATLSSIVMQIVATDDRDTKGLYALGETGATTIADPTLTVSGVSYTGGAGPPPVGALIWESGGSPTVDGVAIKAGTTVSSVGGGGLTILMSQNALSTAAGLLVQFGHRVTVEEDPYYTVDDVQTEALASNQFFSIRDMATGLLVGPQYAAENLAYACNVRGDTNVSYIADETSDAGTVIIRGGTGVTPTSSASGALSILSETIGNENRRSVAYSKPNEPEHFPALNYVSFGSASNEVIRLTPLDDALLVWTLEGLYRVSGSAPDSWRVDLLDSSLVLLRGEMVDVMGNRAWALTNRGLVSAGAGGVEAIVSGKVARDLEKYIEAALSSPSTHTDNMFVCCWPSAGAVIVGVSDSPSSIAGTGFVNHFVYQPELDAWTRWDTGGSSATATGGAKWMTRLYPTESIASLAVGAQWRYREGRYGKSGTSDLGLDKTYTLTGAWSNVGGSTYAVRATVANCNGWVAKVGDWVSATLAGNTVYRRVLTVVDIATYNSVTLDGPIDMAVLTGSATCKAYDGIPITLTYHSAVDGPAIARECQVGFDISDLVTADAFGTYTDAASATEQTPINMRLLVGAGTEMTELARSTELSTPRMTSPASRSTPYTTTIRERWGTTRATARAQHFYPSIWLSEAFCRKLAVLPLVVIYEPTGMKGYYR